jgi:2-haloacid dehalogenase
MAVHQLRAVAFDVNETLFSLERLGGAFTAIGVDPAAVPLWFARLLRDGFALTALGSYRPFHELAAESLRAFGPTVDDRAVETVLSAFRELDPHPDVAPALRLLHDAGLPAVTLTNGAAELTAALLERAGLGGSVRQTFSVDQVRRWKPAPEPYRWLAGQLDLDPGQLALVACHPWDCAGARAAGLVSGWVNRTGGRWPDVFEPPEATGPDLTALVGELLGARTGGSPEAR